MPKKAAARARATSDKSLPSASEAGSAKGKKRTAAHRMLNASGFDATKAVERGLCGLENCGKKLAPQEADPDEGDEELLCEMHGKTHGTGYRYLTKLNFVVDYNDQVEFKESVDSANMVVHGTQEKDVDEGYVGTGNKSYAECTKCYGVWNASAHLVNYPSRNRHVLHPVQK